MSKRYHIRHCTRSCVDQCFSRFFTGQTFNLKPSTFMRIPLQAVVPTQVTPWKCLSQASGTWMWTCPLAFAHTPCPAQQPLGSNSTSFTRGKCFTCCAKEFCATNKKFAWSIQAGAPTNACTASINSISRHTRTDRHTDLPPTESPWLLSSEGQLILCSCANRQPLFESVSLKGTSKQWLEESLGF